MDFTSSSHILKVEITKNSSKFVSAFLHVRTLDGLLSTHLTKDRLYSLLSRSVPSFNRYRSAVSKYSFHELCQFLIDQSTYSFLPFDVLVIK